MTALVNTAPSSLPTAYVADTQQHDAYFLNMILYIIMTAILVNCIYLILIYNEVRCLRKHVQQAENNMIVGGRLLYHISANMRDCLTKLLNMLHTHEINYPHEMKSIANLYEEDM